MWTPSSSSSSWLRSNIPPWEYHATGVVRMVCVMMCSGCVDGS